MKPDIRSRLEAFGVSMESGLEDRNNGSDWQGSLVLHAVSMESGLEDRNNVTLSLSINCLC